MGERFLGSIVEGVLMGVVLGECCDESRCIRYGKRAFRDFFDINCVGTCRFEGCGCVVLRGAGAFAALCFGRHWKSRACGRIGSERLDHWNVAGRATQSR